ncbi:hypothetical protein ElyMa_005813500 [Elysia marginata]|uniref:Uncharacterized protein n=1 Tax=Elysia marginata TaxID=1093978 RepID=A0AAV4FU21_9GAST|nr:hypothetical protein ElyMa_005813500 [Elysia marginata]
MHRLLQTLPESDKASWPRHLKEASTRGKNKVTPIRVPCRLAWAIRDLQPSLQLIFLIISDGFSLFIQSARLSNIFSLGLPLPLFPSNFPVVTKCSSWFLLMT